MEGMTNIPGILGRSVKETMEMVDKNQRKLVKEDNGRGLMVCSSVRHVQTHLNSGKGGDKK